MRIFPHSDTTSGKSAPQREDAEMAHVRVNMGWLARAEKGTLLRLAARTPEWVTPDQLTFLGVSGAFLTMVALAFCQISNAFVLPAILGLFLHWLGDSLDGTLARHRQIERPRIGYFIDHSCDLISQVMIFIGLGLSPYFTIISALLALSMYFLISSYTYLKVMIFKSHQLAYGGVGATELRLVIACWCALGVLIGPALSETEYMGFRVIDGVIGSAWALIFVGFIGMVWKDLAKVRDHFPEENASMQQASWSSSYTPPPAEGFPVDA